MLAVASTVPVRNIGCLPRCGRKDEHMLIFQEWDDGVIVYIGKGGARAFKRATLKYGRTDNLIVGYHNRAIKRTGATFKHEVWSDSVPDIDGYFRRLKDCEWTYSIRSR